MSNTNTRIWYKAKLLPSAYSLFTSSFYEKGMDTVVFFTEVQKTDRNSRVLITPRLVEGSFRIITSNLAQHSLEFIGEASQSDNYVLNIISARLLEAM